jgi:hypothetical protein
MTTIFTILGAIGSKPLGWWPTLWSACRRAQKLAWAGLTYARPMPISIVVALALAVVVMACLWWRAATRASHAQRPGSASQSAARAAPIVPRFQPNPVQKAILKMLAGLNDEAISPTGIPRTLNVAASLVDQALDGLVDAKLIARRRGGFGGNASVRLTGDGREYAIAAGLARAQPRADRF